MKRIYLFYLVIFDAFLLAGIFFYFELPWFLIILPFILLLFFIGIASSQIQLNLFVESINKGKTNENKIALTFDDGPHPVYTPIVLEILKRNQAKATFFLIGKNAEKYPYLVERILKEGHCIGNHSFNHENTIAFKSKKGWIQEIEETNLALEKIIGKIPRFFRPPFGITTPHLASALKETNMQSIGWNNRTFDTAEKNSEKIQDKILKNVSSGGIILMHDTHERIQPLLEQLLPKLVDKNFSFVTINELIDEKPYLEI